MESFEKLQNKMRELESETEHKGYYYKVSDALTIMICGMLCNLQNISDIRIETALKDNPKKLSLAIWE